MVNTLNPEANTAYADIQHLHKMGEDVAAASALAEQRPVTCHEHFFRSKRMEPNLPRFSEIELHRGRTIFL